MNKILMHFDEAEYENRLKRYWPYVHKMQSILNAYNALELPELTTDEFRALVNNHETVIFDKMNNSESVALAGMALNKAKAMNLLEKPEGYGNLEVLIQSYQQVQNWQAYTGYVVVDKDKIKLSGSIADTEKEGAKVYARTDQQIHAFKFAKAVLELANEYLEDGTYSNLGETVNRLLMRQHSSTRIGGYTYEINYKEITCIE